MKPQEEELRADAAARLLAAELGGRVERWTTWLANDRRRPQRSGIQALIPPLEGPGRPRYPRAALNAFIEVERAKRVREEGVTGRATQVMHAFGIGEEGGSRTGRRLDCTVHGQLDEQAGEGFVQVLVANPLLVFRLSIDEARAMAARLHAEASDAQRLQNIVTRGGAA